MRLDRRPWDLGGSLDELADNADMNASSDKVSLGLEAPGGFSDADLVCPAQAVAAGALADRRFSGGEPTEFRIHGVSGADEAFAFAIGMVAILPALLIAGLVLWRADGCKNPPAH